MGLHREDISFDVVEFERREAMMTAVSRFLSFHSTPYWCPSVLFMKPSSGDQKSWR